MRTAAEILAANDEAPEPVLGPYIRTDGPTLLVGPEGSGKSSLLAAISVAVATGRRPSWATSIRKGPVLWITGEEAERPVAEEFKRGGADAEALDNILIETGGEANLPKILRLIRELRPVLVIADPIDVLAPPRAEPRRMLEPLFRDARARGYAIVGVLHTLHGARAGGKLVKGSGDWTRVARSIVYYGPDPRFDPSDTKQRSILHHLKANRGGERGPSHVFSATDGWLGSIPDLDLQEVLGRPDKRPRAVRPTERAVALLEQLLANGPVSTRAVLEAGASEGLSRATMYRAAERLGVRRSSRTREDGRFTNETFWSLGPDEAHFEEESENVAGQEDGFSSDSVADGEERSSDGDFAAGTATTSHEDADARRRGDYPDPSVLRDLPTEAQRARLVEALGLPSDAPTDAIVRRWRDLMREHHPDRGGDTAVAARINAIFGRIREIDDGRAAAA